MKRSLFCRLLACLLALLLLAGCGGKTPATKTAEETATEAETTPEETEDERIGRYYVAGFEYGGYVSVPEGEDYEDFYIRLKEDGEAQFVSYGQKTAGSWKEKNGELELTIENEPGVVYEGTLKDGILVVTMGSGSHTYTFVRGKSEAKAYIAAHPAPTDSAEVTDTPTEDDTEEDTEENIAYLNYVLIEWNGEHLSRRQVGMFGLEIPETGKGQGYLSVEGDYWDVDWREAEGKLWITFDGKEHAGTFDGKMLVFDDDSLQAKFVFGLDEAYDIWEELYGENETGETREASAALSIEKQVVCDRDGIRITALHVIEDEHFGYGIEFSVENDSDSNIVITSGCISVNGATVFDSLYCGLHAHRSDTETVWMDSRDLEIYGIETIGEIKFSVSAVNEDTYEMIFSDEAVTIRTDRYAEMDAPKIPEDAVPLFSEGGITIYYGFLDVDEYDSTYSRLFFINKSGKTLYIRTVSLKLNDKEVDAFMFNDTVADGCVLGSDIEYEPVSLTDAGLENIDDIKSAEFEFEIVDMESYDTVLLTEPLKVQFE